MFCLTGGPVAALQSGVGFGALAYFLDKNRKPKEAHAATLPDDGKQVNQPRNEQRLAGGRTIMRHAISEALLSLAVPM